MYEDEEELMYYKWMTEEDQDLLEDAWSLLLLLMKARAGVDMFLKRPQGENWKLLS
jgi:hypothetical protein